MFYIFRCFNILLIIGTFILEIDAMICDVWKCRVILEYFGETYLSSCLHDLIKDINIQFSIPLDVFCYSFSPIFK